MTSAGGFNFFQQVFFVAKAKRQLQVFFVAKAKRQLQVFGHPLISA
ncbi:hypothetical protein ABNX05_13765 [Lysinibacillus sp. M3]|uniref:Uncharacterized protein n=1 Tax=Lysinibacillus zambalensis TaxID=3160866 RepID=A0ABV1MT52_9BACI